MNLSRRRLIGAIPALIAAPAIVKAESIMPISVPWLNFADVTAAIFRQNLGHDLWYHVRYPTTVSLAREASIILGGPEPGNHVMASWANPLASHLPAPLPRGQVVARGRRLGRVPMDDWMLTGFTREIAENHDRGAWHRRCWEWR